MFARESSWSFQLENVVAVIAKVILMATFGFANGFHSREVETGLWPGPWYYSTCTPVVSNAYVWSNISTLYCSVQAVPSEKITFTIILRVGIIVLTYLL